MTSKAERRRKRQNRQGPSAPRVIGANDNIATANDNRPDPAEPVWGRDPGVKETPSQRIFRQMQRRALDEAAKPAPSYDPSRLTPDQEKRARRATERLNHDDPRKVAGARAELLKIADEVRRRVAAYKRADDNAELERLEALRGGVFAPPGRNEPPDRKRIASRDGLETLMTAKSITTTQHAAGLRYRADYELLDPEKGLTPPPIDQSRNITRGGEGWTEKKLERELFVRDLEKTIQETDRTFRGPNGRSDVERVGRAVWALREIAGKGSNLSALSNSGGVRQALSERLINALDHCALAYGLE